MSKDAYYFSHDANAHNDEKILDLRTDYGWEGYGIYWAIIEMMRNQTNYKLKNGNRVYKKLALQLNVDVEFIEKYIKDCIKYGLFVSDQGYLYSESFLKRMENYEKRKKAARKAANARWNNDSNTKEKQEKSDSNASAMRSHSDSNASKVKYSKVNKRKVKYKDIMEYLNEKADKNYKPDSKHTVEKINGRLDEGFTVNDFKHVIDIKTSQWKDTDMDKYLRPQTLFAPTKFEGYLNEETQKDEKLEKDYSDIYEL